VQTAKTTFGQASNPFKVTTQDNLKEQNCTTKTHASPATSSQSKTPPPKRNNPVQSQ